MFGMLQLPDDFPAVQSLFHIGPVVHSVLEYGEDFFFGQLQVCGRQGQGRVTHTVSYGGE
jgi:hypothetical protein